MARITNADLDQLVTILRNRTKQLYYIESMDGRPRLYLTGQEDHEISPRLSKVGLYQWISGYLDGFEMAQRIARGDDTL